ncbi:MAG: Crp/Fnr family transcriptional regulator [Bacteroidales bacterium]|nr:Crp/Fnr family transcriptional regulator [Bacteroidales bacterium]
MTQQLKYLLKNIADFDEKELEKICSCFKFKSIKKNTVLLSEGEVCTEFYYIQKGCLRTYFLTRLGNEKTRFVTFDCSIGTALTSFISQKPSFEFIDVLEDTDLFAINYTDFYNLNKELIHWKDFYQRILEMAYSFQNRSFENLVTLTAKQRFEQVMNTNPILIQRLSNKVLASYLDITQETLSRIKSK